MSEAYRQKKPEKIGISLRANRAFFSNNLLG
jgi:hypothetical protein